MSNLSMYMTWSKNGYYLSLILRMDQDNGEYVRSCEAGSLLLQLLHALLDLHHGLHGTRVRHHLLHLRVLHL